MTFAATTLAKLMTILSIPLIDTNVAALTAILQKIEAIDSGSFVAPIESTIDRIEAIETAVLDPSGLAKSGMIKADVVEWQRGAGANSGAIAAYSRLVDKLKVLIGLQSSSGGVSLYRSDRYSLVAAGNNPIYDDWRFIAW